MLKVRPVLFSPLLEEKIEKWCGCHATVEGKIHLLCLSFSHYSYGFVHEPLTIAMLILVLYFMNIFMIFCLFLFTGQAPFGCYKFIC